MPVTFSGLEDYRGLSLHRACDGKVVEEDQSVNGNDFWQTDYDPVQESWSITYNVNLDASVASGNPVTFLFE